MSYSIIQGSQTCLNINTWLLSQNYIPGISHWVCRHYPFVGLSAIYTHRGMSIYAIIQAQHRLSLVHLSACSPPLVTPQWPVEGENLECSHLFICAFTVLLSICKHTKYIHSMENQWIIAQRTRAQAGGNYST